jgi:hypothetical protein
MSCRAVPEPLRLRNELANKAELGGENDLTDDLAPSAMEESKMAIDLMMRKCGLCDMEGLFYVLYADLHTTAEVHQANNVKSG